MGVAGSIDKITQLPKKNGFPNLPSITKDYERYKRSLTADEFNLAVTALDITMTSSEIREMINQIKLLIQRVNLTPAQRAELLKRINKLIEDADREMMAIGQKLNNDILPTLDYEFHAVGDTFKQETKTISQELKKLVLITEISVGIGASAYVFTKMWKWFHG